MKRKINIPARPSAQADGEKFPRERRKLGVRFDLVTGDNAGAVR